MSCQHLMQYLPQKLLRDWVSAFPGATFLIDAANILLWCAWTNFASFVAGDSLPAVTDFAVYIKFLVARKVLMKVYFDGMKNPDKQYEDQRRELRRQGHQAKVDEASVNGTEPEDKDTKGLISNSSLYIAQCAKVCRDLDIDFEICREEADAGLAAAHLLDPEKTVVVSFDTDRGAHGVLRWVKVDNWWIGESVLVDIAGLSSSEVAQDLDRQLLAKHTVTHGKVALLIWAAVCGCDYSREKSGISGTGPKKLLTILDDITKEGKELTTQKVAARIVCSNGHLLELTCVHATAGPASQL